MVLHRVLIFCVSLVVAAMSVAPAGAGPSEKARSDAKAFHAAALRISAGIDSIQGATAASVRSQFARCAPAYEAEPTRIRMLIDSARFDFRPLLQEQALIPRYSRFARDVQQREALHPVLRKIEAAVMTLNSEYRKLGNLRYDFCDFLAQWKRARWTTRFEDSWYAGRLRRAGINIPRARGATHAVVQSADELRGLGLTFSESFQFTGSASLIGTFPSTPYRLPSS